MEVTTIGELLHWSYANLAMAHSAVSRKAGRYERIDYIIRARLYKGLQSGMMKPGHLAEDERLKMILPQSCCYCGESEYLSADHLISRKNGGAHSGENLVWACRSCNSSKQAGDALEWMKKRGRFPPLLLLRRYLKLAIDLCRERNVLDVLLTDAPRLPFALDAVPTWFPPPGELSLWICDFAAGGVDKASPGG